MRARPADDQGAILVLVLVVVVILAGAIAAVSAFAFTGPRSSDAHTRHDRVASALDNAVQGEIENVRTGESSCATLELAAADGPTAPGEPVSAFGDEPIDVVVTCKATRDIFRLCGTQRDADKPELSVTVRIKHGSADVTSWQLVPDCDEATP